MKTNLAIAFCSLSILLTGCNGSGAEIIRINGELEETIEVHSEYVDKGVTYPTDKYKLIVDGKVINTILGRYEIKYSIFTNEGELKKELHRFVNVVDTTAPTYELLKEQTYYVGLEYLPSDFFSYSDNYYAEADIDISPGEMYFTRKGKKAVAFTLTDKSNNTPSITIDVEPVFDSYKLARRVSSQAKRKTDDTGTYISLSIMNSDILGQSQSFEYYEDSESLHYSEHFYSTVGTSASIQISSKFGGFSNAEVEYSVYDSVFSSTGTGKIDATKTTGSLSAFESITKDSRFDESNMLNECNQYLSRILGNFHYYMENLLHLDIY